MIDTVTSPPRFEPSTQISLTSGLSLIVIGAVLAGVLAGLLDGFVKGLLLGAGVVLILFGVHLLAPVVRRRWRHDDDSEHDDTWLPSRDGDR